MAHECFRATNDDSVDSYSEKAAFTPRQTDYSHIPNSRVKLHQHRVPTKLPRKLIKENPTAFFYPRRLMPPICAY